jgi:hypothetical protein
MTWNYPLCRATTRATPPAAMPRPAQWFQQGSCTGELSRSADHYRSGGSGTDCCTQLPSWLTSVQLAAAAATAARPAGSGPSPARPDTVISAAGAYFHSQLLDESLPLSSTSNSITPAMVLIRASRSEVVWP